MADNWMTTSEASVALGVSVRTIQRRLADGEYETRTEGGKKYILLPDDGNNAPNYDEILEARDELLESKDELIEKLTQQVEYLQRALEEAMKENATARERTDTIIMQQSTQLTTQQLMIEDLRTTTWQRFKRLFNRSVQQPA